MRDKHWLISIQVDGKQILVIEPDFVGVREMSEEDRQVVCRAAQGLAKFVGCNKADLEVAVKMVLEKGLSTGHADDFVQLMEEVLDQIETEKPPKGLDCD